MKMMKRTLAMMLALVLVLSAVPLSVFAADATTTGSTSGEPFPRGTADSNSFRIPSLVTLSDGTLVAAADTRWNTTYDGGGLDTIVSVSTDNGDTWNYSFANYLGDNGNVYNGTESTCFIDPAMAVTQDDTIYMLVDLYPYGVALNGSKDTFPSTSLGFDDNGSLLLSDNNHSSYDYYLAGSEIKSTDGTPVAGLTVDSHFNVTGTYNGTTYDTNLFFADSPFKVVRTGYLYLTKGTYDKNNKTVQWSAPQLLNLKTNKEMVCLVGPGRGLVTENDSIVFPVYSYDYASGSEYQCMGFIYSEDGTSWKRVDSSIGNYKANGGWSSEAAVVELPNGDLRFFYRNYEYVISYVDYSWTTGWGSATQTSIINNSNTQLSAITYSKTVDGKQVILVSCPTGPSEAGSNQSGAFYRKNGKIFAFRLEEDGTMTPLKSVNVTSNDAQFMYSCMTELADGTLGILYEDKESAWGTGISCYYTMEYDEFDLVEDFGLTFDAVAEDHIVHEGDFAVNFGSDDVVSFAVKEATVDSVTTAYVAYDITPDANYGGGAATVTLPLSDALKSAAKVVGFYVEDGVVKDVTKVTVADGKITFDVPHFSVVGARAGETDQVEGEEISIEVDEDKTLSVNLSSDQYVEWDSADSSYVGVAGVYVPGETVNTGAYNNEAVIVGNNVTTDPVLVTGTVYNADGTKAASLKWLVTVTESTKTTNGTGTRSLYISVAKIENCDVYYSVNGGELIKVNGTGVLVDTTLYAPELYNIMFFAAPHEGYAVTEMSISNSAKQYYSLTDGNPDGTGSEAWPFLTATHSEIPASGSDQWKTVNGSSHGFKWALIEGNMTIEQMKVLFSNAIDLGCEGVTTLTMNNTNNGSTKECEAAFIANKLPTVEKTLNGVLPITRLQKDFRRYTGTELVAAVGEYVYFNVTITLDLPAAWDSSNANLSALEFTSATIAEQLDGAYFYTKTQDTNYDGVIDGTEGTPLTAQDITNQLNAEWTDAEKTAGKRVIELYVVYPITGKDIDSTIINTVKLDQAYTSKYANSHKTAEGTAIADIRVQGGSMSGFVVDFGLPVVITDTNGAYGFKNATRVECLYGDVTIEDGVLTYTPTSILQGADAITLHNSSGYIINSFPIYPATSVYYEEGFLLNNNTGWTQSASTIGNQQTAQLGAASATENPAFNYGYDSIYAGKGTNTGFITGSAGATTTFTFTGTGFQLYGNSASTSGIVAVRSKGGVNKLYMINTKLTNLDGDDINNTTYYGLPFISETDLPYGTYTVTIMQTGTDSVVLDGVRILNTINDETDGEGNIYYADKEDNPDFYELRDYVLNAIGVEDLTDSQYTDPADRVGLVNSIKDMAGQVYNHMAATQASAVILGNKEMYSTANLQQLLDNGPKNELYLYAGQTLVFKVKTNRVVQLGLKAPAGSASFTIAVDDKTLDLEELTTSVDMFYELATNDPDNANRELTITITVKEGSGVLSATLLKVCDDPNFTFNALTQADIETALLSAYGLNEDGEDEDVDTDAPAADEDEDVDTDAPAADEDEDVDTDAPAADEDEDVDADAPAADEDEDADADTPADSDDENPKTGDTVVSMVAAMIVSALSIVALPVAKKRF